MMTVKAWKEANHFRKEGCTGRTCDLCMLAKMDLGVAKKGQLFSPVIWRCSAGNFRTLANAGCKQFKP